MNQQLIKSITALIVMLFLVPFVLVIEAHILQWFWNDLLVVPAIGWQPISIGQSFWVTLILNMLTYDWPSSDKDK
jgi:hypothetical protein